MGTNDQDYALLLEAAPPLNTDLAKQLLAEAGIPAIVQGPDFDVAELGVVAHQMLRGANLYVSKPDLARAREILVQAWGEIPPRFDPESSQEPDAPEV